MALDDGLRTGHASIDAHHTRIITLIEDFRRAIVYQTLDSAQLEVFLATIHDYAVVHFREEEAFMLKTRYPARASHRDAHIAFWQRLILRMELCADSNYDITCGEAVFSEVGAWLKDHIHGEDRALAAWIRVTGNTPPKAG
mgnify:CR=1 FL=1